MRLPRQFWLGTLAGLSLGSVLHRVGDRGFAQGQVHRTYGVWAHIYGVANPLMFGQLPRLRRTAVDHLCLEPGSSVLDVSCGTGANFSYLQEHIGPSGRLQGVDYTPEMLDSARGLVKRKGWENVELQHGDAAKLDLGQQFDGVLWTLAASVVPDWETALERAIAHVRPGGWFVVADARFSERWYARPLNWYGDLMEWVAAGDITRRPWELLPGHLSEVGYEEQFLGFFYVAWGQRPPDAG